MSYDHVSDREHMIKSSLEANETSASMARELNHRVRNMLQIVMGLCNQTLRQSEDLRQFESLFLGRVQALARVYEVVQRDGWTRVSVHDLIESIVSRVLTAEYYQLEGDRADLAADAAAGFGLVIHEITEGARQRGVGDRGGKVSIRWELIPDEGARTNLLIVHWQERTSTQREPQLNAAVYARLQRQLRHELNGSLTCENSSGSLYIKLELPSTRTHATH